MLEVDTFLITLYVFADDFCQSHPPKKRPGPQPSLSEGEVITLALFARWGRFSSERDFYRYAEARLRDAFPTLPNRSQFNRLVRSHLDLLEAFVSHLVVLLGARGKSLYEALDSSAMPTRDAKRRGHGWLAGCADIGWSNSLGWYEGFRLGCLPPQTPQASSRALASVPLPPPTSRRPKPSSPPGPSQTPDSGVWARPPLYPTWSTRALRGQITTSGGSDATERSLSARPNATPARCGPSV